MGNSLMIYLNKRLKEKDSFPSAKSSETGPVITISREVGCGGLKLARTIADHLNKKETCVNWRVLSKEIFYESAKELDLKPERVQRIFKQTDKYTFEEILNAFKDKQYKSERIIVKTVSDIVRSFAVDGFSIIVGRAGHIIGKDIKKALHIRLVAPIEYRINNIMHTNNFNREEAINFINKVEKERIAFRNALLRGEKSEDVFDLVINRASFRTNEIIELIEFGIAKKGLMQEITQKIEFY